MHALKSFCLGEIDIVTVRATPNTTEDRRERACLLGAVVLLAGRLAVLLVPVLLVPVLLVPVLLCPPSSPLPLPQTLFVRGAVLNTEEPTEEPTRHLDVTWTSR